MGAIDRRRPLGKKRNNNTTRPDEITFDPSAREEYLTGFHKRKEQRKKHAQEQAAKQEKEDRVRERQQLRQQRKDDLERHVDEYNAEFRKFNPDMDPTEGLADGADEEEENVEWNGIQDDAADAVEREDEYVDEDKYTTVTVEAMGDSDMENVDVGAQREDAEKKPEAETAAKASKQGRKQDRSKPKVKARKFRYESKAERSASRHKQKTSSRAAKARRKDKS